MRPLVRNVERLAFVRRESLGVGGFSPEFRDYIARHNLDLGAVIAHAGFLNIALVRYLTDDTGGCSFSFDADGTPSAVIEAIVFDFNREPVTVDLVAWRLGDPDAFATAMGPDDGADVLGPVAMVARRGGVLKVYRTPLAWLKAGCDGCVPLKPGAAYWLRLAGGPFAAEDIEHGRELRDLLGSGSHRILIPQPARVA